MALVRGASLAVLEQRAAMLARVRAFFEARGVLEVETPALSPTAVSDPALDSIAAQVRGLAPTTHYLHTSPEYAMKRLLADGSGDIFQIGRVFRDSELGRWHQPEFTLVEWYRVGYTEHTLMEEVAALVNSTLEQARRIVNLTYVEAFGEALGTDPLVEPGTVRATLVARGIDVPASLDDTALLDLAMTTVVVPGFDPAALTFVRDYPAAQAALAELDADDPRVAARFELFCGGLELANGFRELTDGAEQRARFEADLARRRAEGRDLPPLDLDFLAALENLPPCAGVALGFDRLVALGCGLNSLRETMAFAHR